MRYKELFENHDMVQVTPMFLKRVMKAANSIAMDIADDLPKGDEFEQTVTRLLRQIDAIGVIGPLMTVYRAELRPEDEILHISSTGCHWSWHGDSPRIYNHDNAFDNAGHRDGLVEIVLEADVKFQSIDWPYTVATNLIHPAEREITIRSGQTVNVMGMYKGHEEIPFERENMPVYGSYP